MATPPVSSSTPGPAAGRDPRNRLFVAALGIGQICSWGSLYYSFPLIAAAMGPELGWSKPDLYLAATIGLGVSGLAAYPVGAAIDRGHGRLVMGLGALLGGVLLVAWSQVASLALFYLLFVGIGVAQAATLYDAAFASVMRRVGPDQARRGITAVTLWAGFASTVFVPLIQFMLDQLGWRDTLIVLAGINMAISGGLYFSAVRPARDLPPVALATGAPPPMQGRRAVAWALRRPVFWLLALAFVAYTAFFSAFTFHIYPLLLERGMTTDAVVTVMTIIGPAQVLGRIIVWTLAPKASVRMVGSLIVVLFPLSLAAFATLPPDLVLLGITALFWGAANGIITIVRGLAVPELLTRQAYGAVNGALVAPQLIAMALAPLAAAGLWAASGSYDTVMLALIAGSVVMVAGFWAASILSRRPGHGPDEMRAARER